MLASVHLEEGPEAVPLGAACIASALKEAFPGITVSLVESFAADGVEGLLKKTRAPAVEAVGFSLYNWNRAIITEAAKRLRAERPELFLFCGGPEATALPGGLLRSQEGAFDALISGEGEEAAVRLVGARFFKAPAAEPVPSALVSAGLDETQPAPSPKRLLPSPWLDGTLKAGDRQGILWELARGCPYRCAYCYESKGAGEPGVRYFPEDRVRKELRLFLQGKVSYDAVPPAGGAVNNIPIGKGSEGTYVFVLDPTFNSDKDRALRILDMIIRETDEHTPERDSGIHWHFEVRGELLNREQVRRFARLGASLQIGLQTANPKVSALINRDLNRGLFESRIQMLNEEGVSFGLDLIYGLPGDTLAGYRKSLDFAFSLYPDNLDLFRLSVLPGTLLRDRAEELGLRANSEAPYDVISTPEFSAHDLDRAETLSLAADFFYNKGRAVAWFNQVLYPLGPQGMRAAVFLEGFAKFLARRDHRTQPFAFREQRFSGDVEKAQLAYLDRVYTMAKKSSLLPAVYDVVRFHGAWGRALAEGFSTDVEFHYDPDAILSEDAMDIEDFVASARQTPSKIRVRPGKQGPEVSRLR
ncbi:B12-binding domain-containing radical SAM protein [Spirochaetia bacterium]|nr:B12-binding domain-containing radical SAM protein [Spirochaetia bacterium]